MHYKISKRKNPLKRDEEAKYYASPEYGEEIDIHELAELISKTCTLTPMDIVAVMYSLCEIMPMLLKDSIKVRLDNFGIFKISFSAEGKTNKDEVSAADIKNIRIIFTPCTRLKKQLLDTKFTKSKNI